MDQAFNFIVIVSDTLRRDHLGCYGNDKVRTPYLDRFAARSNIFDRAYACSFPTVPNRADLLTGRYTFTYLGWAPLPPEEITLPQLLSSAGYTTMGIVDTPFFMRNGYGYDRGFGDFIWIRGQWYRTPERLDVVSEWRDETDRFAPRTLSAAERWLERHYQERFFLYVDTWDPHEPWDPPAYYVKLYDPSYKGETPPFPCYWYWQEAGLTEEALQLAHDCYCGEITMVDRWIGRLLDRVESLGLMDNTIIALLSDHGFYFGEHGFLGKGMNKSDHGYHAGMSASGGQLFRDPTTGKEFIGRGRWYRSPLYDEVTRIPFLIYHPQLEPRRIKNLVSAPDLMPTILDMAGLECPTPVRSHSLLNPLLGRMQSGMSPHEFVVTSWPLCNPGELIRVVDSVQRAAAEPLSSTIFDGRYTLIYSHNEGPVELYDTDQDPGQTNNVAEEKVGVVRELHSAFVKFLEAEGTDHRLLDLRRELAIG